MRFWKRRLLTIAILMVGVTSIEPIWKLLICSPIMVLLSIDWDDWNFKEVTKHEADNQRNRKRISNNFR